MSFNGEYPKFGQQALLNFLKDNGYTVNRSTILRYGQNGYIWMPNRKTKLESNSDERIYYSPLVAIEVMVAFLLFKGDWLKPESTIRFSRMTGDEVFLARASFYKGPADNYFDFHDLCIYNFKTSFRPYVNSSDDTLQDLAKDYAEKFQPQISDEAFILGSPEFYQWYHAVRDWHYGKYSEVDAGLTEESNDMGFMLHYSRFNAKTYEAIFRFLYFKYKDQLLEYCNNLR